MKALKALLISRPGLVRLVQAVFALMIAFGVIEITPEQIAVVIAVIEAVFAYLAQVSGLQTERQFIDKMNAVAVEQ